MTSLGIFGEIQLVVLEQRVKGKLNVIYLNLCSAENLGYCTCHSAYFRLPKIARGNHTSRYYAGVRSSVFSPLLEEFECSLQNEDRESIT